MSDNITRKTVENNGCTIEYYEKGEANDRHSLIISMGIWEPAERAFPLLFRLKGYHCVVLSYRGRGGSDTPETGYDWEDHAADLGAVFSDIKVNDPIFMGFSKGVSYMLGFVSKHPGVAKGLIILDYPAIHTRMPEGSAEFWYERVYNGRKIGDFIDKKALYGIEREAKFHDFYDVVKDVSCPIWLFRGADPEAEVASNLKDQDIANYQKSCTDLKIINFNYSGHMILDEELSKASKEIRKILQNAE